MQGEFRSPVDTRAAVSPTSAGATLQGVLHRETQMVGSQLWRAAEAVPR